VSRSQLSIIHGPVYGGGHSQVIRMHDALRERGFDTVALVPTEPGTAKARLEAGGVEVLTRPLHRLRATPRPLVHARLALSLPREVASIRQVIRERGIDVVQVFGPTNPHGAIAARLEGVPVVWQLYEMRTPAALRRLTMPYVRRLADVVMSTGREVARLHPGALAFGDRLVTYVPPVDFDEFRADAGRRAAARTELGIPDGVPALGTLGNLNPDKGHEFLVEAAARARAAHPALVVRVLGASSPPHARYEAGVRSRARALGLTDEDVIRFTDPGTRAASLLPGLDVFVLASRREGIPTVLLEAMATGVPVVATDVGGVREIVEHGVSGLVVPPRDPEALAVAVDRLLSDRKLSERVAATARRAVVERYGVDRCADAHAHAFNLAIAATRVR
jgi:glycosyltransferase involved in cell wall biosynthesis